MFDSVCGAGPVSITLQRVLIGSAIWFRIRAAHASLDFFYAMSTEHPDNVEERGQLLSTMAALNQAVNEEQGHRSVVAAITRHSHFNISNDTVLRILLMTMVGILLLCIGAIAYAIVAVIQLLDGHTVDGLVTSTFVGINTTLCVTGVLLIILVVLSWRFEQSLRQTFSLHTGFSAVIPLGILFVIFMIIGGGQLYLIDALDASGVPYADVINGLQTALAKDAFAIGLLVYLEIGQAYGVPITSTHAALVMLACSLAIPAKIFDLLFHAGVSQMSIPTTISDDVLGWISTLCFTWDISLISSCIVGCCKAIAAIYSSANPAENVHGGASSQPLLAQDSAETGAPQQPYGAVEQLSIVVENKGDAGSGTGMSLD